MKKLLVGMALLWSGLASGAPGKVIVGYGTIYDMYAQEPSRKAAGVAYTAGLMEQLARQDLVFLLPKTTKNFIQGDYNYVEGGARYKYWTSIERLPRTNQVGERELDAVHLDGDFLAHPKTGVTREAAQAKYAAACQRLRDKAAAAYKARTDKKYVSEPFEDGKPGFCTMVEVTGPEPHRMFHFFTVERIAAAAATARSTPTDAVKAQDKPTPNAGPAVVPKLVLSSKSTKAEDEANAKLEADRRKAANAEQKTRAELVRKLADEERATKAYAESLTKQGRVVTLPQYADYLEEHQAKTWCDRQIASIRKDFEKSRNQLISIGTCGCKPGGSGVSFTKEYRCEVPVTLREFHSTSR